MKAMKGVVTGAVLGMAASMAVAIAMEPRVGRSMLRKGRYAMRIAKKALTSMDW
jgi:ATP-dependent protease ClpP protease subunit